MKLDPQIKGELKKAFQAIRSHGGSVELISAYALNEQDKKELSEKIGILKNADVTYTVDPSILAGVIVKFGSKMIDLSLQNELQNLQHFIYERI